MSEGRSMGERLAERISGAPPAPPIADPCEWIERRFGVSLWSKQREVVESVIANRYTAVRAAHSTGKSKIAGLLMGYWIAAHPVGSAFVFSTAPRSAQVRGILWKELGAAHRIGNLPGNLTKGQNPEWWIGDEQVGVGRKPADLADPEEAATAMQGHHAEHLLCILDEAAGLAPWVWDAIDSLASNQGARVLAIGNPTIRESTFYEVCAPGSGWNRIKISAFDSPNLTGEQVPDTVARNLVSREWVEARQRKWGATSSMYRGRVLAEFPEHDVEALIAPAWVEAAHARELPDTAPPVFAVDVARSGSDESVIASNRAGHVRIVHTAQGAATTATTGALMRCLDDAGEGATGIVDVIGVGGGVLDSAVEQEAPVSGFNSSHRANDPARFKNRRAEAFWHLREQLRTGTLDLDPADEDLSAQLLAIRWHVDSGGRIVIESKDDMKARGVSSPDRADAVMMALAPEPATDWAFAEPIATITGDLGERLGDPAGGAWEPTLMERKW
jgi:hypothetical protein